MRKRIIAIFIVLFLLPAVFTGCKKDKEEEKEAILSISSTQIELEEGKDVSLVYSIENKTDDTILVVEIEDDSIIRIENDKIYGLKKGNTTFTIYLEGQSDKYTISVSVKEKEVEKPEVRIMNKPEGKVALYTDYNFISYISDKTAIDWSVSDESIATITSKGTFTGIKEGKVTVTLTSRNHPTVSDSVEVELEFDAWKFIDSIQKQNVLVQTITAYGATEQKVEVLGSVSDYYFGNIEIKEAYGPINTNSYTGKIADEGIMDLDEKGYTRPGIYLEELKYITYHDTANISENADAKMHNDYMYSQGNKTGRARSWHYTVDDTYIYHNVPDNEVTWQGDSYEAYAKSIGIETCVNIGSDFYRTWQRMGKLVATLLNEYGLGIDAVRQHYDFNKKDCPKTLRNNGLWSTALNMIKVELIIKEMMSDYTLEFETLSPKYLDNTGKVIYRDSNNVRLAYTITLTDKDGNKETKLYHSNLEGKNAGTYIPLEEDINTADAFDLKVSKTELTLENISLLLDEYLSFSDEVKALVGTYEYLKEKELEALNEYKVDSNIVINKVFAYNGTDSISKAYSYIELKNISSTKVSKTIKLKLSGSQVLEIDLGEVTLAPSQTYIIAFGDIIYNGAKFYDFIVPNKVVNADLEVNDFTITVYEGENTLDKLGVGSVSESEGSASVFTSSCIQRKQDIDTNDNSRDFSKALTIEPTGSKFIYDAVFDFDYKVLALNREIKEEDGEELNNLKDMYEDLSLEEKLLTKNKKLLDYLLIEYEGLSNPSLAIVKKAILMIPSQIVDDYSFPKQEGLTFEYKDSSLSDIFDIENGIYGRVIFDYTPVTLVATYGEYSEEFTVNFGVCSENDKIIYVTGGAGSPKGNTSEGFGTYEQQKEVVGFGGVAIKVDGKVFFIGKNCLIELDASHGTALTRQVLRPYGKSGANDINNTGFVAGAPAEYKGTGILYHNNSTETLTFDLTDTYGRANAGSYGYAKVFFTMQDTGEFKVTKIVQHTGENYATDNYQVELAPGEYIWCPHTFETNATYGTWFMFPGDAAAGGMLEEDTVVEFVYYKNIE